MAAVWSRIGRGAQLSLSLSLSRTFYDGASAASTLRSAAALSRARGQHASSLHSLAGSGELSDFITRDVRQRYAHVKDYVKVTLIEANEILSSFDIGLRQYATNHLSKYGVNLVRGIVKEVKATEITLSDGTRVPYGLLVWSTGVGPSEFVRSLHLPKSPGGRVGVDEWLRVPTAPDVFALGDCAGFLEGTGKPVLPALAQVAEREGRYLARLLGRIAAQNGGKAHCAGKANLGEPFVYKHIGSMASVGRYKALVDLRENKALPLSPSISPLTDQCNAKCGMRLVPRFDKSVLVFAGCQGGVDGWLPQLADVAVSVPDTGGELEEQVLRGGELGNDACVWQGQYQDWLTTFSSLSWCSSGYTGTRDCLSLLFFCL
ncbi:Internal alternative NAD(P)H-ubiquinone oxidoreductase A1, mitochondrial [Zea mays]|uniref:Internal alternative NAD(P)H-ubiquinone oxidoreductase A1, mitochondrial n=1 Tax=Zea mays TaxID=4577 RepID=A0A3L6DXX4_MAIZE|nr:Internal alternative NAD(P)H-ubiquinone oxidoreductase A1, mitochondrial [Zea mays]